MSCRNFSVGGTLKNAVEKTLTVSGRKQTLFHSFCDKKYLDVANGLSLKKKKKNDTVRDHTWINLLKNRVFYLIKSCLFVFSSHDRFQCKNRWTGLAKTQHLTVWASAFWTHRPLHIYYCLVTVILKKKWLEGVRVLSRIFLKTLLSYNLKFLV